MESLKRILVSVLGTVWYIVFFWFYVGYLLSPLSPLDMPQSS